MVLISNLTSARPDLYEECWAIMRSVRSLPAGVKHMPDLSPSKELFFEYLRLRENNQWNKVAFDTIYVPRFLGEMRSKQAKQWLNYIYYYAKQGVNFQLCCVCSDETLCHRTIVGGLLEGAGCTVEYPTGASYLKYKYLYDILK